MTQSEAQRETPRREINVQGHASKEPKMELRWSKRRLGNEAQRVRNSPRQKQQRTRGRWKVCVVCSVLLPGPCLVSLWAEVTW